MPVRALARGVQAPDVVADLVRAHLRELGAGAEPRRAPLAREHARRAAGDHEVERLHEPAGDRPGPLGAGGHGEPRGAGARAGAALLDRREAHAAASSGARCAGPHAPPTRSITAPSTSSAVTPSPIAS